jgi:hypothetical protein
VPTSCGFVNRTRPDVEYSGSTWEIVDMFVHYNRKRSFETRRPVV